MQQFQGNSVHPYFMSLSHQSDAGRKMSELEALLASEHSLVVRPALAGRTVSLRARWTN